MFWLLLLLPLRVRSAASALLRLSPTTTVAPSRPLLLLLLDKLKLISFATFLRDCPISRAIALLRKLMDSCNMKHCLPHHEELYGPCTASNSSGGSLSFPRLLHTSVFLTPAHGQTSEPHSILWSILRCSTSSCLNLHHHKTSVMQRSRSAIVLLLCCLKSSRYRSIDFSMLLSNDCRIWFGTLGSSTCDSNMFHLSKSSSAATTSINAYCFSGGTSCHKHHLQVVVLPSLHLVSYSPVHLWPFLHCYSVTWHVSLKNFLSEGSTRLKSRLLSILFQ